MKKVVLFLICSLLGFAGANAQSTSTIKGFVSDKSNGEALLGASVQLTNDSLNFNEGGQTDVNGFFSVAKVKPGSYVLTITFSGYVSFSEKVELNAGDIINKRISLVKKPKQIVEINVKSNAKRQEKVANTAVGINRVSSKEIKALPSVGGEPDIAQYLQVLPGVVFTGDQGGQLFIRGGSPVQNKILLDGMTIYNPFHSIGLFSVFETEGIRNAEVMSGGFGAEYGDRTSAIVSINMKDGNKKEMRGKVGVSPILAKVFLEGPLIRAKNDEDPAVTFVASYKNSYLSKTSTAYAPLGETYKAGLPFDFSDLYGKISISAGSGSKFNVFGFNFNDRVNYPASKFKWNNYGIGTNFIISPQGANSLINGGFNYSDYVVGLTEQDNLPRNSKIGGFNAFINVSSFLQRSSELKYGFEINGFNTLYEYYNYAKVKSDQDEYTTQAGAFMKYKTNFANNKVILEPSFRVQYYASLGRFSPEPRIAGKWNVSKNFRIKAATGRYSQNLISAKSDRDIVNLFTGFLSGPDNQLYKVASGKTDNNNIQYANHYIGGFEYDYKNFEFMLEPWYKDFRQLIGFNRYKLFPTDPDFLVERGKASGLDLTAKYNTTRLSVHSVFSLGKITRFDGKQTYPPPFDRRYNINLVTTYTAGKKLDLELSARLNYGSAFPFTLTQSIYEQVDFTNAGLNTDYLTQNGQLNFIYDNDINAGRLSDYHRLDINAKKRWNFGKKGILESTVSVTNAYNRQNIFYVNRITNQRQYQLPFFPTVAIGYTF